MKYAPLVAIGGVLLSAAVLLALSSLVREACELGCPEQKSPATASEICPACPLCAQDIERATHNKLSWTLALPIDKSGRQFVGLKVYDQTSAPWAPEGFNQLPGIEEDGTKGLMVMGYVNGPTVFQVKLPSSIKRVDVEIGVPTAGGHKFTVTQ